MKYELVIAAYKEPLDWLSYLPKSRNYTVKLSCSDPGRDLSGVQADEIVTRENHGREAGHWLGHIVDRYDSLEEWTVFLQGEPFYHAGGNLHGPLGLLCILFGHPVFTIPWAAVGMAPEDRGHPCP